MKITFKYLIIFILGLNVSCIEEQKPAQVNIEVFTKFPYIKKSQKIKPFALDDENPTWLTTAFYEFNYLGKISDTVVLKNRITFLRYDNNKKNFNENHLKYCTDSEKYVMSRNWNNAKIEIQVSNTSISNSIPVLIRNNNKDTIAIGYGSQIPIVMEALNENYEWKPIQKKFIYMCGVGLSTIILPPGEIAITLAPVFKGFTKTRLRLVLGNNVSKPFWGFINKRQFESKFEGGDFKEEYKKENPQYNDS